MRTITSIIFCAAVAAASAASAATVDRDAAPREAMYVVTTESDGSKVSHFVKWPSGDNVYIDQMKKDTFIFYDDVSYVVTHLCSGAGTRGKGKKSTFKCTTMREGSRRE
jgi:hypothetical protein